MHHRIASSLATPATTAQARSALPTRAYMPREVPLLSGAEVAWFLIAFILGTLVSFLLAGVGWL